MIYKIGLHILTMFGIGYIKFAPATIASFITCLIYILVFILKINFIFLLIFFLFILVYSVILINKLSSHFKEKDPKEIVIDEFIGQSIPIITLYYFLENNYLSDKSYLISFILIFFLFRFFDIIKIFPANIIDKKMKNGLGVVLDDVVAGVYSTIIFFLITVFLK